MVIRTRLRSILFPLALYAFSGGVSAYFVWHADNGDRGLKDKAIYVEKIQALGAELAELKAEREALQLRVGQFQINSVDKDLLDEQTHRILGRAHRNEMIVTLPPPRT